MKSRLLPGRSEVLDLAFLVALGTCALLGFAPTLSGSSYLVVGLAGLLLGAVVAHAVSALRAPPAVSVLAVVALFCLLGPPLALRGAGTPLPGADALRLLAEQLTDGWKDLLTTLPPIDSSGPVLVLPWTLGLLTGWLGLHLSRVRPRWPWLAAVAPVPVPLLLLAAVILLGVGRPHSLWVQGVLFGALCLTWVALRWRAQSGVLQRRAGSRIRSLVLAAGMVALATALALPVANGLGAAEPDRVHLRPHVEPPFDIGQYPSPLSSFRRYVEMPRPDGVNLYTRTLLTVDGAPTGSRVRFAALDHYDGVVWGAANDTVPGTTSDRFQKVSSIIDNPTRGKPVEVTVTLGEGWSGVWLPTIGALTGLEMVGEDSWDRSESFRYNLATSTAVVPSGVGPGDRYRFTSVLPPDSLDRDAQPSPLGTANAEVAAFLDTQAVKWSGGASEPLERVFAVAAHLKRTGKYSDGVVPAEQIYHPGHHVGRLADEFVNAPIMVGNDEQYAAVMALLANRIGVPARVVMGAVVPEGGVIKGSDVQAWVELRVADGSWRTLPTEAFMDFDRPAEQLQQKEQELSGTMVPPPAPIPPPSTAGEQTDSDLQARKSDLEDDDAGFLPLWVRRILVYVGGPLLLALLVAGGIVGAKALRRRRRRNADRLSTRVSGAWHELVDHARDFGQNVPMVGTRREQAAVIPVPVAPGLARRADALVFGPADPDELAATDYWAEVDRARGELSSGADRWRRLVAAVNLRTFARRDRSL